MKLSKIGTTVIQKYKVVYSDKVVIQKAVLQQHHHATEKTLRVVGIYHIYLVH
jgi:hypothetical protein